MPFRADTHCVRAGRHGGPVQLTAGPLPGNHQRANIAPFCPATEQRCEPASIACHSTGHCAHEKVQECAGVRRSVQEPLVCHRFRQELQDVCMQECRNANAQAPLPATGHTGWDQGACTGAVVRLIRTKQHGGATSPCRVLSLKRPVVLFFPFGRPCGPLLPLRFLRFLRRKLRIRTQGLVSCMKATYS
jgi:hypothetical protein